MASLLMPSASKRASLLKLYPVKACLLAVALSEVICASSVYLDSQVRQIQSSQALVVAQQQLWCLCRVLLVYGRATLSASSLAFSEFGKVSGS